MRPTHVQECTSANDLGDVPQALLTHAGLQVCVCVCVLRLCTQVLGHPWFNRGMLALILASSISLAINDASVTLSSTKGKVLWGFDVFFTACFWAEVGEPVVPLVLLRARKHA